MNKPDPQTTPQMQGTCYFCKGVKPIFGSRNCAPDAASGGTMKPASRDCMSVFREDDDPQRTETYRRGFNNGLEEAAKIVETKMWSKRRSVADLIRAQQVNT